MLSFMHEYVTCTCQKQAMLLSTIKHANANLIKKATESQNQSISIHYSSKIG